MGIIYFSQAREELGMPQLAEGISNFFVAPLNAVPFNDAVVIHSDEDPFENARGGVTAADSHHFDWREQDDVELSHVLDQKTCGACWAVAVAGAVSDRIVTLARRKSKTLKNPQLSPVQLMGCLVDCENACAGCEAREGLQYVAESGLLSSEGIECLSYSEWAKKWLDGDQKASVKDLCEAVEKCVKGKNAQLYKATSSKVVTLDTIEEIKQEIFDHGPVVTTYQVFDDFIAASTPKSPIFEETGGIYIYRAGENSYYSKAEKKPTSMGWHTVVIVGYGVDKIDINGREEEVPYWIVRNSWGTHWGDEGYCKIAITNSAFNNGSVAIDVPQKADNGKFSIRLGGVMFCDVAGDKLYGAPSLSDRPLAFVALALLMFVAALYVCSALNFLQTAR